MTLYVKCCPRNESRTDRLAKALLDKLGDYEEIDIANSPITPLHNDDLIMRESLIAQSNFSHPMFNYAKQFTFADTIVIAAPHWDLSFPSALKIYIENIYVTGLITSYDDDGTPHGKCCADMLYYVTTSGGPYDPAYSYDYISTVSKKYFGIKETKLIYADMLDIDGYDPNQIITDKINSLSTSI